MRQVAVLLWLRYNIGVVITQRTRPEDDRLRKELQNADLEKFKRAIGPVLFPRKTKKRTVKKPTSP